MVNNFDQIRSLLKFEDEGDCYYVQLLRRQSDDPHTNGVADPRYHGNMHSRSIKDYLIPSLDYFDKVKEDIIKMCDMFNVRAYIRLNKRTYKSIALEMMMHIAQQCKSGETFNSPYHLVASAAGQVCSAGNDKTWIVDLDKEYVPYQEDMLRMMFECEPYVRNINSSAESYLHYNNNSADIVEKINLDEAKERIIKIVKDKIPIIPTKNGKHIISKPFNTQSMTEKWNNFCKDNGITLPTPRVFTDPENKYTTFELTDVYLDKAKDFESFLPEHETIKKDKNKISFKMDKLSDWDLHMIDFYWYGYCLKNQFWMKMCDVHKDNPTGLYFP